MSKTKLTIPQLRQLKEEGKKVKMIVCYDYPMAAIVEKSEADMILVGDSLGMVVMGLDSTVPVNMEEIIYHLRAVRRATPNTFVVADLPFMSYQASVEEAIRNAGRLLKEGADCVKLEGGLEVVDTVKAIVRAGVPVMAHIGLTPQTVAMLGGFKVQGKSAEAAEKMLLEAQKLEEAGAFAVLLECVPSQLAKLITEKLSVPTIGTGAGPDVDGHCLNAYDLLGIFDKFVPKFIKQYAKLGPVMVEAFNQHCREIDSGEFPKPEHCFNMNSEDLKRLY
ncbi:3-methyl-2-oxobutanoate hydroxymethyltransferase [Sporomusa carbonis]|uniref:3-methyl-2-oxobutanoate hydroxymethyltransferase n=1 Tax=Sporomusa carbonis TaxID=3076075 RepID=UPI003A65E7D2